MPEPGDYEPPVPDPLGVDWWLISSVALLSVTVGGAAWAWWRYR